MLAASDLAGMQATQEAAMMDLAVHMTRSVTVDSHGEEQASYADGAVTPCGLTPRASGQRQEVQLPDHTRVLVEAQLRLPLRLAETVRSTDRFRVIARFGQAIAPVVYEVIGEVERGPSGVQVPLKRVTV